MEKERSFRQGFVETVTVVALLVVIALVVIEELLLAVVIALIRNKWKMWLTPWLWERVEKVGS